MTTTTTHYRRGHDFLITRGERIVEFRRDFGVSTEFGRHYKVTDKTCAYIGAPSESGWQPTTLTTEERQELSGYGETI